MDIARDICTDSFYTVGKRCPSNAVTAVPNDSFIAMKIILDAIGVEILLNKIEILFNNIEISEM